MTMTCHVLHAGDGYTYLTNQVAAGDLERSAHEPLVDYYSAAGNPPGLWVGSGLAELGVAGQVVTEEHMLALFGEGLHPEAKQLIAARIAAGMPYAKAVDSTRLGRSFYQYTKANAKIPLMAALSTAYAEFEQTHRRRPTVAERRDIKVRVAGELLAGPDGAPPALAVVRKYLVDQLHQARKPVSGFDLVFSPVKSVSVLWALGGHQVRQVVEQVHQQAWEAALAYGEREAGFTRVGAGGVAQIDTSGFVAAAFTHRDSRAGDPDLHTHAVVANRVLGVDGQWRTLDSQQVHRVAVSMSETYNAALEQGMTQQLGVAWTAVSRGADRRPVREIQGVPAVLISGFSQRRSQVEAGYDDLVAEYVARYGRTPSRSVQIRLAQQATLQDRPDKPALKSLAEQITDWRATAEQLLPGQDLDAVLAGVRHQAVAAAEPVKVTELAAQVVQVVSEHRASWSVYHVRAEAIRALKPYAFASAADREQVTEQVVATALGTESIELGVQLSAPPPTLLQRANGESIYTRHGATRYTSHAILDAETRLLTAAGTVAGPVAPAVITGAAIAAYEQGSGRTLNAGQRQLVTQFVGCGRALSVGIGPPGTGKSTAMRAVRAVWESTGGRVLGLAPSAAAASVLGDELGGQADLPARTLHSLVAAYDRGATVDVRAGDMLLVDEAGMAGTRLLDRVRAIAAERGAVLRLIGDYRQLAAVEAGGALRLLHNEVGGTELVQVHRFGDPAEAAAVLALRVGDPAAVDFYSSRGRLHGGTRAAVLDQLYAAWRADGAAGRTSIMISDSTEVARELSGRAQTERRAAGLAETTGVRLHDDTHAGTGDRVVTRRNTRRLAVLGGADYVKNGDLWDVLERFEDGSLRVRHARHGGKITLPADYVAEHLELGYAATIHRSQGLTVQVTRAYLSPLAVREAALVALSRGTDANHGYLDTETVLAVDEPEVLPGDLFYRYREHDPVAAAFATIIRREGAELSATEQLRQALDAPFRLDVVVPQYLHALTVYRGPSAAAAAADWVHQALPEYAGDIVADPAWPALAEQLLQARDTGADPAALLTHRAAQRPLHDDPADPARSVAQVLHHRLTTDLPTAAAAPGRPDLLPGWVPTPPPAAGPGTPEPVAEVGQWLREQAEAIADRVRHLGEQAATQAPRWSAHLGPVPDDPLERDQWIAGAGQVAAYRERFAIATDHPDLLPGGEHGQAARARTWVQHHLAPTTTDPADRQHHQPEQPEPDRVDLSLERTFERMDRWRAEHERTPATDQQHQVDPAELDRIRQQYNQLTMDWMQALVAQDTAREQAADAAMAAFADRHRKEVQVIQQQAEQQLAELTGHTDADRDQQQAQQRQAVEQAWKARPHSHLTHRQLAEAIDQQHSRAERAAADQADKARQVTEKEPQVAAGQGSRARAVDAHVTELAVRAALATEHKRLALQCQSARSEAHTATSRAFSKDIEREHLSRWDSLRHPGRRDRLQAEAGDLRAQAARNQHQVQQLLDRMGELTEQAGGAEQLRRAVEQARLAVEHHQRDRHAAHLGDQRDLERLHRDVDRLGANTEQARTIGGELVAEQQLRADMPVGQKALETELRTTWQTQQRTQQAELQRQQQQRVREHERTYQPPHLERHIDRGGPSLGL